MVPIYKRAVASLWSGSRDRAAQSIRAAFGAWLEDLCGSSCRAWGGNRCGLAWYRSAFANNWCSGQSALL